MSLPSDDSELRQQLAALSVGQRLKLTVNAEIGNGATFVSDELQGATIQASKHHVMGMLCVLTVTHVE